MSGTPPDGFELHDADDILADGAFADEISKWFGTEGLLDMRAYLRFRMLQYFKDRLLPDSGPERNTSVTKEEVALNMLFIDFALRQRYYFTLSLFLSEVQAFSKFDERLCPLVERMTAMTTDDFEKLTPILNSEQVTAILQLFNVEVDSNAGQNVIRQYQEKSRCSSLIQLILGSLKRCRGTISNANEETVLNKETSTDFIRADELEAKIYEIQHEMVSIKTQIESEKFNSWKGRYSTWARTTDQQIKQVDDKCESIYSDVETIENTVQLLTESVDTIRVYGGRAILRFSSYAKLTLKMRRQLYLLERSIVQIRRKLAPRKKLKSYAAKRSRLRRTKPRKPSNYFLSIPDFSRFNAEKFTQTPSYTYNGGPDESTRHAIRLDVAAQTDTPVSVSGPAIKEVGLRDEPHHEQFPTLLESRKKTEDPAEEGRTRGERTFRDQSVQTETPPWSSILTDAVAVSEQNQQLHEKVAEQNKRIGFLTVRLAQLQAGRETRETSSQVTFRGGFPLRDAATNTGRKVFPETPSLALTTQQRPSTCRQFDVKPLMAALRTAKTELAALKRERRSIQDEHQSDVR